MVADPEGWSQWPGWPAGPAQVMGDGFGFVGGMECVYKLKQSKLVLKVNF